MWTRGWAGTILLVVGVSVALGAAPARPKSLRLYIFDCGGIKGLGVELFGFKAGEVPVRDFYADLGASKKVLIDLACSSHNAMWEKNHLLLFQSSLEWLTKGTVNGMESGTIRMGY